jgi:hypothetical protein
LGPHLANNDDPGTIDTMGGENASRVPLIIFPAPSLTGHQKIVTWLDVYGVPSALLATPPTARWIM